MSQAVGSARRGLKAVFDREKDAALSEVGREVIRVRAGGLGALGGHSIVCAGVSVTVLGEILRHLLQIRGEQAVAALLCDRPGG